MKRLFAILSLVGLLAMACEPMTETPVGGDEDNLVVLTTVINIDAEGGVAEIPYAISQPTEGVTLEATTTSEWVTITVAESIHLTIAPNTAAESRVAIINITYGADECGVAVQQAGAKSDNDGGAKITVQPRKVKVSAMGGQSSVEYLLSGAEDGAVIDAAADAEWITGIAVESREVLFTVAKNKSTAQREATLTLSYGNATATVAITQEGAVEDVVLMASNTTPRVGESVKFSVVYGGEDVTAEAKICDYYTKEEVANPLKFDEVGERAFEAKYDGKTSKLVSIVVNPANAPDFPVDGDEDNYNFKYRMLLIDHTGTDCGYCPYMMESLKTIEEDPAYNDYFNVAMAHSYNTSDPAYSNTALTMRYYYQKTLKVLTGFPTLTYNYQYGDSAGSNISYVKNHFGKLKKESTDVAVAVAATLDGDKVIVSASLKSKEARSYKFNILLLEDDIYGKQYGAWETWMSTHNNAIRASYAAVSQADITGTEWGYVSAETTSNKVFEMTIGDSRVVKANCKVLVIIAAQDSQYGNKYEVVNTTMCDLGESKPFEYR